MKSQLIEAGYCLDSTTNVWGRPDYKGIAYSDGDEVEERIAAVVSKATDLTVLSAELRRHCTDWPSLYHLDGNRANILRPFQDMLAGANVLELGAGCGSITRYLGECGATVLAVEGSPRRAAIARSRSRDLANISVVADRFDTFESKTQFDFVIMIGVLEYANLFTKGEDPPGAMLARAKSLLTPTGRLIVAIENQLGLKYFAGVPEDHLGVPMYSIEGRYGKDQPKTFGRATLTRLLQNSGFANIEFLVPFPDYKLPVSIITEEGTGSHDFDAAAFAWQSVIRDRQTAPYYHFSLEVAWPIIFHNRLVLDLANSFLIVASNQKGRAVNDGVLAYHYSTGRKPTYCKETVFTKGDSGNIKVAYRRLGRSEGDTENDKLVELVCPDHDVYRLGALLSREFVEIVTRDGWTVGQVSQFMRRYLDIVEQVAHEQGVKGDFLSPLLILPSTLFDVIPQNIIIHENDTFSLIDNEWEARFPLELGYLLFRALFASTNSVISFGQPASGTMTYGELFESVLAEVGVQMTSGGLRRYMEMEQKVQEQVSGPSSERLGWDRWSALPLPARSSKSVLAAWDAVVAERDGLAVERDGLLERLTEHTSRLALVESTLAQKSAELDSIHNSFGWKGLLFAYRSFDAVLPPYTGRRAAAGKVFLTALGILRRLQRRFGIEKTWNTTVMPTLPEEEKLASQDKNIHNLRAIAFYLPQFHTIPENDEWWGKGFTEWTNVSKAKPLFEGHYQPHVPGELGYYDLRSPEARKAQAVLARKYGIYGFCYYHYWFNGKLLLNEPLDAVLTSGKPEFPFCVCWANEDWTRGWDGRSGVILIQQNYNDQDDREHLRYLAPIFADRRYIRVDGKPLFLVYRVNRLPDPKKTAEAWREEARNLGIGELYLCRVESFPDEHDDPGAIGFDASVEFQPDWTQLGTKMPLDIDHSVYDYGDFAKRILGKPTAPYTRFPCITPSWDNSPRRKRDSVIFAGSTPAIYEEWFRGVLRKLKSAGLENNLVFINAWNEWGEGNHLEPDVQHGRGYLEATKRVLSEYGAPSAIYERLVFPEAVDPLVSIIIPVYNQFAYTYNCLSSVLTQCSGISYEVLVADDRSTDETEDLLSFVENVKIIRNSENLGFLRNCNHAAKYAKGKYIVFLNNDTSVLKDWLESLIGAITRDERIGLVGSKLVFPDGKLQEAGSIIWSDGSASNYGRLDDPGKPEYNYVKEVDYVTGASMMIRRSLWEEIGGFDENFAPAYYEDPDLAFEVRKRNYKVVYQPKSVVVHHEGLSHGTDLNSGIKKYQTINQRKFAGKWRGTLQSEQCESGEKNVFQARDRSQLKRTILVTDNSVPDFDKHAGSRTIFQFLEVFVEMGFNIKFIDNNYLEYDVRYEPYTGILEQMGIEVLGGQWYRDNWKKWVKQNSACLDFIYLHKAHPSAKYMEYLKDNTNALIVYNCADFHYLREIRQFRITRDRKYLEQARKFREIEFDLFRKSDVVLTYSGHEKFILEKKMPGKKVCLSPLFFYNGPFPLSMNGDFTQRSGLTFVGGFAHLPNIDAVIWFAQTVFPKIQREIPDIKFSVVGSNPPEEILRLQSQNIDVTGFVSDDKLAEYYKCSKIIVAPVRFGAGVKGKIIEAIAHGVPVVTTTIGVEGIPSYDKVICVADGEDEFAQQILDIYHDEKKWTRIQRDQVEYAKAYLSVDCAKRFINTVLGGPQVTDGDRSLSSKTSPTHQDQGRTAKESTK